MKKILFICKGYLDQAVPIISIAQAINSKGNDVEIVCGNISDALKNELKTEGLKIISLNLNYTGNSWSTILKLHHWAVFRRKTKQILADKNPDLLYLATADTAIALRGLYSNFKYVLHLRELHNEQPHYMKLLKHPAQLAYRVVVPEENRAYLYYHFLDLKKVPTVIPNKPFHHPQQRKRSIEFLESDLRKRIASKKNIIYQGPIHAERNLGKLIEASISLKDYNIILMGKDFGCVDAYRKRNSDIIHIPFIRPPLHLNITSWAHIGVITYNLNSLNTIYCAPNKIWEFSGFKIPVLGNLNPGLIYTVGAAQAGIMVDFEDKKAIIDGIQTIEDNYDKIQDHAYAFYNSVKPNQIVLKIDNDL